MKKFFSGLCLLLFLLAQCPSAMSAVFVPMETPHFFIFHPKGEEEKAEEIRDKAEADYQVIAKRLGLDLQAKIPLYLYTRHRDFRKAAGVLPHDLVVGTSERRSGLIRMDASDAIADPDETLTHEIVHSVLALGMGENSRNLPLWMNEGLAQVIAQPPDPGKQERVRVARGEGLLRPLPELAGEFPHDGNVDVYYAEAYSAVEFFIDTYGWEKMRELIALLEEGEGFSRAFREVTGNEATEFYKDWQDSLVRRGIGPWLVLAYTVAVSIGFIWAAWMAYRRVSYRRKKIEHEEEQGAAEQTAEENEEAPSS